MKRWLIGVIGFVYCTSLLAGEFNPVLNIGDPAPTWKSLPGVDDKAHSLADLAKQKVIVLVFTCNSCPYAVDYEGRLKAFDRKYRDQGVSVVAVNVNRVEEDRLPAMKDRAAEQQFKFAYLYDESQKIAREYGATYTPECFVIGQDRRIAYMGAMDDSPDGTNVVHAYVEDAVQALLKGEMPALAETVAIGCRVRLERVRRSRKPR